MMYKNKKTDL